MTFSDRHNKQIEAQSLHGLEKAFHVLVDMEIELEHKLELLREVKARILIEIDLKTRK